jgi:hypothetical protein
MIRGPISQPSELLWGLGVLYDLLTTKTRSWSEPPPRARKTEDRGSLAASVLTKMAASGCCADNR